MAVPKAPHQTRSTSPNDVTRAPNAPAPKHCRGVAMRSLGDQLSSMVLSPNLSKSLGCGSSTVSSGSFSPTRSIDSLSTVSGSSSTLSSGSRRRIAAAAAAAHAASTTLGADIACALLKQEKKSYNMEAFNCAIRQNEAYAKSRPAMVSWMIQVVGAFGFSYDTVLYSSMYFFDAAFSSEKLAMDAATTPAQIQLLAITALQLSIKVHGHVRFPLANLLAMAHVDSSVIGPEEVTRMERRLLPALDWHLNPPSPGAFAEQYCDEIDLRYKCIPAVTRRAIRSMAMNTLLPIVIASHGEDGVFAPASVLAYAACWIAIESCSYPSSAGPVSPRNSNLSARQAHRLSKSVARIGGNLNARSPCVQDACCRLSAGLERQQQQQQAQQMQYQQMQQQLIQQQQQQFMYGGAPPAAPGYGYSYFTPPKPIAAKKPAPSPATVCADPYFQQYQQQQQAQRHQQQFLQSRS